MRTSQVAAGSNSALFSSLPKTAVEFMNWNWPQVEPFYLDLEKRALNQDQLHTWMADWTTLTALVNEAYARHTVATTCDTTDKERENRFNRFLEEVYPKCQSHDQQLKLKLLGSRLMPENFDVPLKRIATESEIFREENLPLFTLEKKLGSEYNSIISAQTVLWDAKELTLTQLEAVSLEPDRNRREQAWRLASERQLRDRDKLNRLWAQLVELRQRIAQNAGFPNYRAYRWKMLHRYDYAPEDCRQFHHAIEQTAAPAARRILERRKARLGYQILRPWDLNVDPENRPKLVPFRTGQELAERSSAIFDRVDPTLGRYFEMMRSENLLDLDNRKGKAPGGYCTTYFASGRPFIFMNSIGRHGDVKTMIHEAGHAFHAFEKLKLPYARQWEVGSEFNEVASMAMELLGSPYLTKSDGGFYTRSDAARARIQHLENIILFWPYMAVVDAFQHWVYEHEEAAKDPSSCDKAWSALWDRFMLVTDWSGLEDAKATGWHRKLHIFRAPFYYVEYGLAQLGAVQIWRNALADQPGAVQSYLRALALGGTAPLPKLYQTAGARFAFDAATLGAAVSLIETKIAELEREI